MDIGMTVVPLHQVFGGVFKKTCRTTVVIISKDVTEIEGPGHTPGLHTPVYQSPDQVLPLLAATESVFDMDNFCVCS